MARLTQLASLLRERGLATALEGDDCCLVVTTPISCAPQEVITCDADRYLTGCGYEIGRIGEEHATADRLAFLLGVPDAGPTLTAQAPEAVYTDSGPAAVETRRPSPHRGPAYVGPAGTRSSGIAPAVSSLRPTDLGPLYGPAGNEGATEPKHRSGGYASSGVSSPPNCGEASPNRVPPPNTPRICQQGTSMNTTTDAFDAIARAKAPLKRDISDWNIVHSSKGRWWAFLDPNQRRKDTASTVVTAVDADTAEGLYELLAAAES